MQFLYGYFNIFFSCFNLANNIPPGEQVVNVNIFNNGHAIFDLSNKRRRRSLDLGSGFIINFIIIVTSVNPGSGGIAGGTTLTIQGSGFGTSISGINVKIGGVDCDVESANPFTLKCITGPHAASLVDVVLSATGITHTFNEGFTYDESLQPTITQLSPTEGPVYGGTLLTISGTSFPDVVESVTVTMGASRCEVQSTTSTEITCVVPSNPPGDVKVVVDSKDKGRATYNGIDGNFTSKLQITGVTPKRGALSGGTMVTIAGEGFGVNKTHNQVMLGGVKCKVVESSETQLKCITPKGGRLVNIDNSGSHPGIPISTLILVHFTFS